MWRDRAACAGVNPEWFDPPPRDDMTRAAAFAVCRRCPVMVECATEAVTYRDSGIRGGVMLLDGRPETNPPRLDVCGTPVGYRRHIAAGERSCPACRSANRVYDRDARRRRAAENRVSA
jgi:hypothetical protein